jgi:malate dehydrogenase (quinone)
MKNRVYDVVIVGGGISGCALTYMLAKYTDVKSIAMMEKYDSLAPLNSNARANSQTLHCGDIETNYKLEKAKLVKKQANMVVNFAKQVDNNDFLFKYPKMIMAVGEEECERLRQRHEEFAEDFPYMQLWDADQIAEVEPAVTMKNGQRREEKILASGCTDEYSAVNYGLMSKALIAEARKCNKDIRISLGSQVHKMTKIEDAYEVNTAQGTFFAKFVVVSAGAHSLLLANQLGHGLDMSILPMGGSFYYVPKMLNGKVYTMQNDKLPFAALHGDPDLVELGKTRLGPTALVLPKLERYTGGTYWDFWKSLKLDTKVIKVFWDLMKDRTIRNYIFRNFMFEVPYVRKRLFAKDAQKILPDIQPKDLEYANEIGGLRPQVINKTTKVLQLGEASIVPENDNLIFNMTPSPGATTCLGNAYRDALIVCERLGINVKRQAIVDELLDGVDYLD